MKAATDLSIGLKTLDNGVRVVTVPRPAGTTAIHVHYTTGSRSEPAALNGGCHLMEHMFFKGTTARPDPFAIMRAFGDLGVSSNAWTDREATDYHVRGPSDVAGQAAGVLNDMLTNALIERDDFEREKHIVLEEKRGRFADPQILLWETVGANLLGDCALGRSTIGSDESILGLDRDALLEHVRAYYVPANIIIGISGIVDDAVVERVIAPYASMAGKPSPATEAWPGAPAEESVVGVERDMGQVQFSLAAPGLSYLDPHHHVAEFVLALLGGGYSSRLFEEIRERRQLAYTVGASMTSYRDAGFLMVDAGVDRANLSEAVAGIVGELRAVIRGEVTQDEVDRTRAGLIGGRASMLDDHERLLIWAMTSLMERGEIEPWEENDRRLKAITRDDVIAIAGLLLNPASLRLLAVGENVDTAVLQQVLDRALEPVRA